MSRMSRLTQTKPSERQRRQEKGRNPEAAAQRGPAGPHADILALQRSAGNRAVSDLVESGGSITNAAGHSLPPIVQSALTSGPGQPMDPETRAAMESRFGEDFSQVRVHTDGRAAESAKAVDARAYTVGRDIVFSEGVYTPHSGQGSRLLAHELAHVIQQERGGPSPPLLSGGRLEQSADAAAAAFASGRGPIQVGGASAPGLARQPQSLGKSLSARDMSDEALEREIAQIGEWLDANPGINAESDFLNSELQRLQDEAWRRSQRDAKRQRIQAQTAAVVEAVNAGRIPKWMKVFPFRPSRGIFRMDVAPIMARRQGQQIVVEQPLLGVAYTDRFKQDVKTLPWAVFQGGLALRPDELVGVRLYDEGEKVVVVHARDLLKFSKASDFAVFLNIGLTVADVVAGPYVGKVAGKLVGRAGAFVSRKVIQPGLIGATLGVAEAAPIAFGRLASKTGVELAEDRAVSTVVQQTAGQTARQTAVGTLEQATVQSASRSTQAAGQEIAGAGLSRTATAPIATATGIAATHAAGSALVQVTPAEYASRLSFVYPQQYENPVLNAVEQAGQQAAAVLTDAATPAGARFIQVCQSRSWALAGTLFHAEAARQLRQIAASLAGIQMRAEDVVKAGAGGSRLDVTAVDATGNHYNIDWKTTGKSAFRKGSRSEMERHSAQYQASRGAPLDLQISKSWVDFVRSLIPNVRWPK
jgi:hypothetical protein